MTPTLRPSTSNQAASSCGNLRNWVRGCAIRVRAPRPWCGTSVISKPSQSCKAWGTTVTTTSWRQSGIFKHSACTQTATLTYDNLSLISHLSGSLSGSGPEPHCWQQTLLPHLGKRLAENQVRGCAIRVRRVRVRRTRTMETMLQMSLQHNWRQVFTAQYTCMADLKVEDSFSSGNDCTRFGQPASLMTCVKRTQADNVHLVSCKG